MHSLGFVMLVGQVLPFLFSVKRGIKIWIRCDSKSGFMHQFEFYLGKKASPRPSSMGLMFDIVDRLTRRLHGQFFRIYFDNAYTSVHLLLYLLENDIYSCGTCVMNRKLMPAPPWPRGVAAWQRGDSHVVQDFNHPNLTLTGWLDTKLVRFLSTMSSPTTVGFTTRRVNNERTVVNHPEVGSQYSTHYAGVDRFDQKRAKYRVGRFSRKGWKYYFHFMLNAAVINSWILYDETSTRPTNIRRYAQIHFRQELVVALIGNYSQRKRAVPIPPQDPVRGDGDLLRHRNVHMQARRPRRCRGHKDFFPDARPKQTVYGCKTCDVFLCKRCHDKYHR